MQKVLINNLLLIFILALAIFIRSINIGKFGLYGDEKYSIMVMNGISWEGATQREIFQKDSLGQPIKKYFTPKQFWASLSFSDFDEAIYRTDNGNSATYYMLLKLWKNIFGQSDAALRWMGVLFDCFTIILLFLFCKNILKLPIVGYISGFLAAIEPFMLAYSHQVRNYPVGIFLTLFSAYIFFKILKNEANGIVNFRLYFAYGLVVLLSILCHFYVVMFIFCQFILLIVNYLRDIKVLKRFVITYIISFAFLGLWFTIGSGRYTISTFKEKDQIFLNMVNSKLPLGADLGNITKANYENIKNKVEPIIYDNFLLLNNIYTKITGKFNLILCLLLSFILLGLLVNEKKVSNKNVRMVYFLIPIIISVFFYFLFTLNPLYYIYLSIVFVLVFLLINDLLRNDKWRNLFVQYGLISFLLPIIITILAAVKAGHTANIYQKYLSFGLPFGFILMAMGIWQLTKRKSVLAYLYLLILAFYLIDIYEVNRNILEDNYPKYTIMPKPRLSNPYISVANSLEELYQPGDTIIYPNAGHAKFDKFDPQMQESYVSIVDAQLTNIYLPKNADYWQRVDANEPNKVFLYQKAENKKLLIFDFEGSKYRY